LNTGTSAGNKNVIEMLNNWPTPIVTDSGFSLDDFDLISGKGSKALYKNPSSNNALDATVIIWRNNKSDPAFEYCACEWGLFHHETQS
jgi:hypothetical protein